MARWTAVIRARSFRAAALLTLLLAGCLSGSGIRRDEDLLVALEDGSRERREEAFQELLRGEGAPAAKLRAALGIGARQGFPVAALLYAQGRGDAVPLDLRARHHAGFEWPRIAASENAVVEPYVRGEVERDLVRAGRPALKPLGRALEETAESEAAAMRIVRAMLRIGGRAATQEFARLLESDRDLGGPRVCDAAAAALLYLGKQELALRIAGPDARVAAARGWWDVAKDFPESEWIRESVEELAARMQPKDPEGVRAVMELLVGQPVEDPRDWWDKNRDWRPAPPPLRPEDLLPALALDRPRAFDANRRLEEATGTRVFLPRMERVSELAASLRLWRPPPDLALRWKRYLEAPLLRLSIAAIGTSLRPESQRIRWAYEAHFHPTEGESGELRIETQTESYSLFIQAFDLGTRLVASESHGTGGLWSGVLREFREGRPVLMFSAPFKSALVAVVEEVSSRRAPPPPALIHSEWRARLRAWADSADALRALGYFQDAADLDLLRGRRAGAPLLLLGDPAALQFKPRLEPYEIDMALRKAEDPRVREYLEALRRETRTGSPP
jgi:hypothetical protein